MHYSNLKNEEWSEDKLEKTDDVAEIQVAASKGSSPGQDPPIRKEAYWFLAMVLTFLMIGSIVFYVSHTKGNKLILHFDN